MKLDRPPRLLLWACAAAASLALVLYLISLMIAISINYQGAAGRESPKVTDWMQAWGSVVGVLAGFAAALAATLLLLFERNQARRLQVEQKREGERRYAELVTWYLREQEPGENNLRRPGDSGEMRGRPVGSHEDVLVIVNNSHSCIYEVIASIPEFANKEEYKDFRHLARRGIGTIPPGETKILMPIRGSRGEGSGTTRYMYELPNNTPVEYIQFRDPADRIWARYGKGELKRLPYSPPGQGFPHYPI